MRKGFSVKDLKRAREERGLSIPELAKAAKISPQTIHNWEKHGMEPRAAQLRRVVAALRKFPKLDPL